MSWFGRPGSRESDMARFEKRLTDLQKEDSVRMVNSLVERCFFNCVTNFRVSNLDSTEELCVNRCVEKFLRHMNRVSRAFAEQNAMMMAGMKQTMDAQQQQQQQQQQQAPHRQ